MIQPLRDRNWQPARKKRVGPELTLKGLNARLKLAEVANQAILRRLAKLESAQVTNNPLSDDLPDLDIDPTGKFFYRK